MTNQVQINVTGTLRLRGIKVVRRTQNVIFIDKPTAELKRMAVEIIENIKGQRQRRYVVQFQGTTLCWNKER